MKEKLSYDEMENRLRAAEAKLASLGISNDRPDSSSLSNYPEPYHDSDVTAERLTHALLAANAGIWEWDLRTNANYWSDELWKLYGLEKKSCAPSYDNWLSTVHPDDRERVSDAVNSAASNSTDLYAEWRVINTPDPGRWLMSRGQPVKDSSGRTILYRGIVVDITESKRLEEKLNQNQIFLQMGYDIAGIGTWVKDIKKGLLHFDDRAKQQYGLSDSTVPLSEVFMRVHPEDRERLRKKIEEITTSTGPGIFKIEYRVIHPDKSIRWLNVAAKTEFSDYAITEQHKPEFEFGTCMDITELKAAEHNVLESKAKLDAALESMTDAVFISDAKGNFIDFNDAFATFHKFKNKQECAKTFAEYPDILDVYMASGELAPIDMWAVPRALRGEIGTNVEYSLRRKDTGERWVGSYSFAPIKDSSGAIVGSVVVGRDITEKKGIEEALRQSEEKFAKAFMSSPAALIITRISDGLFLELNEAYSAIVGYSREELIGRRTTDLNIYLNNSVRQELVETLKKQGRVRNFEASILNKSQHIRHVTSSQELITFNGQACILTSIIDITERKIAEEKLKALNAELEAKITERTAELADLYNNAPCGYHSLNDEGVFVYINDTELNWLGYTRDEIINKAKVTDLFTPASNEVFKANFPVFKSQGIIENLEFDMVRKDGTILPILLSATAIKDKDGKFIMSRSTMVDYTYKKKSEMALQESQASLLAVNKELEAFAYSISHDLRAPLRSIDGFTRMIQEDYGNSFDAECQRKFNVVRTSAQQMDRLITDILHLSRITRSEMILSDLDMNRIAVSVYDEIVPEEERGNILFTVTDLPIAYADHTLIKQVWTNLIGNSIKYTKPKNNRKIEVSGYMKDGFCSYIIRDNGVGFDSRYSAKLFGIFQRLHKASDFEGTGVGLAIVQRIINRHGGSIWAEGEINKGAAFFFQLPAAELKTTKRVLR